MSFQYFVQHALRHLSPSWKTGGSGGGSYGGRSLGSRGSRQGNIGLSFGPIKFSQNGQDHDFRLDIFPK